VSTEIATDPFVRSGRTFGVVGICLAAVSVTVVLVAVILMGADTGSSLVGPTDDIGFGLLAIAGILAIAAVIFGGSAISSRSRRLGIITIVVTVSSVPLSFAALLVLDALVGWGGVTPFRFVTPRTERPAPPHHPARVVLQRRNVRTSIGRVANDWQPYD
jgi:chromate transport protein ChrA